MELRVNRRKKPYMIWLLPWDEDASVRHLPWATWTLVLLNILAFAVHFGDIDAWMKTWALVAAHPQWQAWWTSCFAHFDMMHLVGNMMFLLLFGDNVEDVFGPLPFLALYFLGGMLGNWWFVSANPLDELPAAGASGCIATLAGAYAILFFTQSIGVKVMFFIMPVHTLYMRAPILLLFWFGFDIARSFGSLGVLPAGGGSNFVVHAAGFLVGVAAALLAWLLGVWARYQDHAQGHALLGYCVEPPAARRRPLRRRR